MAVQTTNEVMIMCANPAEFSPDVREYFNTLPISLQETILQSGTPIHSKEELVGLAQSYLQPETPTQG